jgi:hypothetical protein
MKWSPIDMRERDRTLLHLYIYISSFSLFEVSIIVNFHMERTKRAHDDDDSIYNNKKQKCKISLFIFANSLIFFLFLVLTNKSVIQNYLFSNLILFDLDLILKIRPMKLFMKSLNTLMFIIFTKDSFILITDLKI